MKFIVKPVKKYTKGFCFNPDDFDDSCMKVCSFNCGNVCAVDCLANSVHDRDE